PLLTEHCLECHGDRAEGGLRLDSREAVRKGGSSGPAIVAGDPDNSLLWQVVSGTHDEISMPPQEPLNPQEILILSKWIAMEKNHPVRSIAPASATDPDTLKFCPKFARLHAPQSHSMSILVVSPVGGFSVDESIAVDCATAVRARVRPSCRRQMLHPAFRWVRQRRERWSDKWDASLIRWK
ncbi:MAG: hypothetical protein HKN47_12660, partial [Pirellulaceae bacterium]|nr:hypothetical protein [Pirellulaceae bacterium]